MKKLLAATLMVAGAAVVAYGQPGVLKLHTRPVVPPTEALDRMGLKLAWSTRLQLRGNRDGFASVQLIPGPGHPQLLTETYSGIVAMFDAETGDLLWENQVGKEYSPGQPPAANNNSVFISRRNVLYVLNRVTGLNRLFTVDKFTGVRTNGIDLPYMPSASPSADDTNLYFVMDTRAVLFRLPNYGAGGEALRIRVSGEEVPVLPEPGLFYPVGSEYLQLRPLVGGKQFLVTTAEGRMISLSRYDQTIIDEYTLDSKVVAMPSQYDVNAYIGTVGGTLYAINMDNSKILWRYLPGGSIRRQPAVFDRDVFVTADQLGIARVTRDTGREIWVSRQADRFLAANDKFVYALDARGEFRVIDLFRGGTLARYDLKDWNVPVLNELTDRVYLAANDGQIICLRHRDLPTSLRHRALEGKLDLPPRVPARKKDQPKEDMDPEKKDEDKKDPEKKEPEKKKLDKKDPGKKDGDKKDGDKKEPEKKDADKKDADMKDVRLDRHRDLYMAALPAFERRWPLPEDRRLLRQ